MTKADLVEDISTQTGVSKNHTALIVDNLLDALCRALSEGSTSRSEASERQGAGAPRAPGPQHRRSGSEVMVPAKLVRSSSRARS